MANLDPITTYPNNAARYFAPPSSRLPGPRRWAGLYTPAGPCPIRTLDSFAFGYRSGHPAEALPAAGNIRMTDAHELVLLLWAAAGPNSVSLPLTLTAATDQPPRLRVAADALLGIAAAEVAANPALTTEQTLTLNFNATSAGRARLSLVWLSRVYTGAVEYGPLSVS